jgi:Arc/MetJ-type ribon-helix-helix transcriptional regulator
VIRIKYGGNVTEEVKIKLVRWETKVPSTLNEQVKEAIKNGRYASRADLVRDAVRKTLETLNETKPLESGKGGE